MANKFIGETSGKYWKQKNDETYVNEDELVKITDLDESDSVEDDDLLIKGNSSTGTMLRIKVANFLDGIKGKLLGNTDISSIGDGTVTGAISENAENISTNKEDADKKYSELNSALATLTDLSETRATAAENVDFVANNYTDVSISVSRSGYTPIALLAAGTSSSTVFAYNLGSPSVSNDTLSSTISYRNISSSDVTGRPVYVYILWRKNS